MFVSRLYGYFRVASGERVFITKITNEASKMNKGQRLRQGGLRLRVMRGAGEGFLNKTNSDGSVDIQLIGSMDLQSAGLW